MKRYRKIISFNFTVCFLVKLSVVAEPDTYQAKLLLSHRNAQITNHTLLLKRLVCVKTQVDSFMLKCSPIKDNWLSSARVRCPTQEAVYLVGVDSFISFSIMYLAIADYRVAFQWLNNNNITIKSQDRLPKHRCKKASRLSHQMCKTSLILVECIFICNPIYAWPTIEMFLTEIRNKSWFVICSTKLYES